MAKWARTATLDMVMPLVGSGTPAIETDPATCAEWKLGDRFRLWLGEFFANVNAGFPWAPIVRQKNPSLPLLTSSANAYAASTPGVATADLTATLDGSKRHLAVSGFAVTDEGATVTVAVSP